MKRRVSPLLALVLLPAALLVLPGRFGGDAQLQEPTALIDPDLIEALKYEPDVKVLISLKGPDIPFAEQTQAVRRQNAAER